jgi:dihydroorotase
MNIVLKNISIVYEGFDKSRTYNILIENGNIVKIGNIENISENYTTYNMSGKTCFPGFFDMHVHFREPGHEYKEDIESGSQAALNGGLTGVLMMPNTIPPIDNAGLIQSLKEKTKNKLLDIEISACISKGREGNELSEVDSLLKSGAAALTDDGSGVINKDLMFKVLEKSAELNFPVLQHAEDIRLTNGGVVNLGKISETLNLKGISCSSETSVVASDILLALNITGSRYHIQHISCGKTVELVRKFKKEKSIITCEVCPHHFVLTDDACLIEGTNAKMNPPLRESDSLEQIWEGLRDGTIDVLCTDHAPHSEEEKSKGFELAPFGIIGLETLIGLSYTYLVETGIITIERMSEMLTVNPRKILGIPQVEIKTGAKANLTILDLDEQWVINKKLFKSKSKNTPFDGFKVKCKPFAVINNNQIFFSEL